MPSGPLTVRPVFDRESNLLSSKIIAMADETPTYRGWKKLPDNWFGRTVFSLGVIARVPYFGTVLPRVEVLEPGHCEVTAPKWFGVYNHLHTVHAIAACNVAELAMGMLCEATVPTSHRWIPKAMTVHYTAKATTRLRATARLEHVPDFATLTEGQDLVVLVTIRDTHGVEVVHADITTWITPR
jgi:acyl-coenzyme A thioesterase PaaI-like protein